MTNEQEAKRLFPDPLPLSWTDQGDEWLERLQQVLTEREAATGLQIQREPPAQSLSGEVITVRVSGDSLEGELRLFPESSGGVDIVLAADSSGRDHADKWRAAILEAIARLGTIGHFRWWGVVGLSQSTPAGNALAKKSSIGGLTLHASGKAFTDLEIDAAFTSLNAWSYTTSFPCVVEGQAVGFSWHVASGAARRSLVRLCAVLTLALGESWFVRSVPSPIFEEGAEIEDSPYPDRRANLDFDSENLARAEFDVPPWADSLSQSAESEERIDRAMLAYYQGTLLEEQFPSSALLAYVGCIEGLGGKYEPLRRCDCCGSCPVNVGAMAAFRRALHEACVPDDMIKYLKKLYSSRSTTAHEGALHGGEESGAAGEASLLFSGVPETSSFRYGAVGVARRAAREVLLHEALGCRPAELPPIPALEDQFPRGVVAMATSTATIVIGGVE
jgi:hypothetical protein